MIYFFIKSRFLFKAYPVIRISYTSFLDMSTYSNAHANPKTEIFDVQFPGNRIKIRAEAQMSTTKNIERQMVSVGDPISQKNATSGFTWDRIPSKTK